MPDSYDHPSEAAARRRVVRRAADERLSSAGKFVAELPERSRIAAQRIAYARQRLAELRAERMSRDEQEH
jgi:hypothetical protein